MSTRASSSRLDSAHSSDEIQKVSAIPSSNTLARFLARLSWIVTEDHTYNIVEAPSIVRLTAAQFSLLLLLPWKLGSIVAHILPEAKVEEPEVEEPEVQELAGKRTRSTSTSHPVASVSLSISITDWLSLIRDFVGRMGVKVEFAETEAEIRGYLQAKLENAR